MSCFCRRPRKVFPGKKQHDKDGEWQPEPFLFCDEDGKLQITQESVGILSSLKKPVTVVAIAGVYQTGKSLLLNRLARKQTGFPLGPTVEGKTKGIWLWVIPHPNSPESRDLILLDTEGLANPASGGGSTHDAWIFSMAILLSSCLVYNSVGPIDDRAIEALHLVTKLTERIHIKSGGQDQTGEDRFIPLFVWVLQDFVLDLKLNGQPCTADKYLERALKLMHGSSKHANDHNLPRKALMEFFPEKKCFTMVRPVDDESKIRNMDTLKERDLKRRFREDVNSFRQFVFDNVLDKAINGKTLNGSMLLEITRSYTEAINNGAVPCIENAFKTMAEKENCRAVEESANLYREKMSNYLSNKLPISSDELSKSHEEAEKNANVTFLSIAVAAEDNSYKAEVQKRLAEERDVWVERNERKSTEKCRQVIEELYKPIRAKVQRGEYTGNDAHKKYMDDRKDHQEKYERTPNKGVSERNVLWTFNREHETEEQQVLAADSAMLKKEKEIEEQKMREKKEKERIQREKEQLEARNQGGILESACQAAGAYADQVINTAMPGVSSVVNWLWQR